MRCNRRNSGKLRRRMLAQDPHCAYCGRLLSEEYSTIDHVVPRSVDRVNADRPDNLVLACPDCNIRKGDRLLVPRPARKAMRIMKAGEPRRDWTEREIQLLGTDTDVAIAKRIGRSKTSVEKKRRALKIASHMPYAKRWTKRGLALLGQLSDAAVAKRLRISRLTVLRERERRGIPCANPHNRPAGTAPAKTVITAGNVARHTCR